jgi:hypothetical protein
VTVPRIVGTNAANGSVVRQILPGGCCRPAAHTGRTGGEMPDMAGVSNWHGFCERFLRPVCGETLRRLARPQGFHCQGASTALNTA